MQITLIWFYIMLPHVQTCIQCWNKVNTSILLPQQRQNQTPYVPLGKVFTFNYYCLFYTYTPPYQLTCHKSFLYFHRCGFDFKIEFLFDIYCILKAYQQHARLKVFINFTGPKNSMEKTMKNKLHLTKKTLLVKKMVKAKIVKK